MSNSAVLPTSSNLDTAEEDLAMLEQEWQLDSPEWGDLPDGAIAWYIVYKTNPK